MIDDLNIAYTSLTLLNIWCISYRRSPLMSFAKPRRSLKHFIFMTRGHDTKFSPKMNYFFMFNMKIMKMNYFFMFNMKIILFCWLEIKYLLFLKQNTEHLMRIKHLLIGWMWFDEQKNRWENSFGWDLKMIVGSVDVLFFLFPCCVIVPERLGSF